MKRSNRPTTESRRGRRLATSVLTGVVASVALLLLTLLLGLQSAGFRGAILGWVTSAVERSTGIHATARDFHLSIWRGEVGLEELELRGGGSHAGAFLSAPLVEARLEWLSLLSDRPQILYLRMERPGVDLGAPLPEVTPTEGQEPSGGLPSFDLVRLEIVDASVRSAEAPERLDPWLDRWAMRRVDVDGRMISGAAELQIEAGEILVESHRRPPIATGLKAGLSVDEGREFSLRELEITGEALQLRAQGTGSVDSGGPIELNVDLRSDLAALLPDLTTGGRLEVAGDLVFSAAPEAKLRGDLQISAHDFPAELLEPLLATNGWQGLRLEETQLDLMADLTTRLTLADLDADPANDLVSGEATLTWRRAEDRLVIAGVRIFHPEEVESQGPIAIGAEIRILPEEPGSRSLEGRALVSGWKELRQIVFEDVRLEIREDDLAALSETLGLSPATMQGFRPAGGLSVVARVDGPVQTLDLDLEGIWRLDGRRLIELSAEVASMSRARVRAELLPDEPGARRIQGGYRFQGREGLAQGTLSDVQLAVEVPEIEATFTTLQRLLQRFAPDVAGEVDLAAALHGLRPAGSFRLAGQARGPLQRPDLELDGLWSLDEQRFVEISARTAAGSGVVFRADLLPAAPGIRRVEGSWIYTGLDALGEGSFAEARLEIDIPQLESSLTTLEKLFESLLPDPLRREQLLAAISPEVRERLTGVLRVDCRFSGAWLRPDVQLSADWVPSESEHLSIAAAFEGRTLSVGELSGSLRGLLPGDEPLRFSARGGADIERPVRRAAFELQVFDVAEKIGRLDLDAQLEGGILTVGTRAERLSGEIRAAVPLGALRDVLEASVSIANLPLIFDRGAIEIEISALDLDRAGEMALYLAGFDESALSTTGLLDAVIFIDPTDPLAAIGTLEIERLGVTLGETKIESASLLRVDLEEGRIALVPTRLQVIGAGSSAPVDLALSADLDSAWQPGHGLASLIEEIALDLEGTIDSSLLTPFLAGGTASGPVSLDVSAFGPIDRLEAEIRLEGREASLVLPGRYRTRISEPILEIGIDPSGMEIREGWMRLNRGEVTLGGSLGEDRDLRLSAELDGVRYRLDHGLTVSLDGNLDLFWPHERRKRLSGTIDVERGSLRRDISLERELLRLLNPSDLAGVGTPFQESVDLDLNLITREGVRIKNNLADLRADWDLIRVRGTLAQPTLAGTVDVDPGGLVTAYGQTVRIDQGSLTFSGVAGDPPQLDFETTTSAEDPRIRSPWSSAWSTGPDRRGPGGDFWDRYDPASGANAFQADEFASGLSRYFQNRFLQSISGGAPVVELSVQPLPLMGETDTTARVTMSYRLTPQISYVLSQNPREAEGRTDILNLQNFAVAPSLRAQFFRNDDGNEGVTLQQMLEFGGGRPSEEALPRLRSIELSAPEGVRKRMVRRATGLRRGQPLGEGADFDIEIDMLDGLARQGYPSAEVAVQIEPAPRNRVNVGMNVEPGTRVDFEFTGDRPRRTDRRDIIALYQPTGLAASPALETVRRDTVRALRTRGFLEPVVEVTSERKEPGDPSSDRVIRVHGEGGRQVNPENLEFPRLPADVQANLVTQFSTRLSRVELAVGEPAADQLLVLSMQTQGYTEPTISSRELSADGTTLVVVVEPGPRRRLAEVRIVGMDPALQPGLEEIRVLASGDPVRSGQIAHTSFLMEDYLRNQGFAEAEVQARLEPAANGNRDEFDLFFEVEAGREHRIGELRTKGLSHSSPGWVESISKLETGELLTESGLTQARRNLARTGVFQRISIRREGDEQPDAAAATTPITFELEEHPRYRVTYGVRGESSREAGVVTDVSDLNFLGRGQTLGLRLIYSTLERNARLYWSIPRVRQTNKTLEFFVEARREELNSVTADIREAWAQITFPWGKRSVHRFYTVYKQSVTENRSAPEEPAQRVVNPFSGWQVSFDTGERSFFETSTDRATVFLGSDLSFSSESLGSDYTGYGWFGQLKPQIPLVKMGESALVWVHNYRTGLKEARGDDALPFFDRLFAGGEFSIRGYPTNSLGPRDENGTPLGGEALFVTNQELRFPVWSLLSGVAFFDAGNVWATVDDVDSTLFTSAGVGLRTDSPIGPLRLDLAFPLDRRQGDPEYKLYFGLGQTF